MNNSDSTAIAVAIISLISSLVVALMTIIFNSRHDKELSYLNNRLEIQKDEQTAIRDYEYDARRRLYEQFEPLLFQLVEHSDNSLFRIKQLARAASDGDLKPDGGWLSKPGYFAISTIYKLLLPLAIFKLMQRELTIFDLDLVPSYKTQYLLSKSLYFTFSSDFELRDNLDYKPETIPQNEQEKIVRQEHPEIFSKQGIYTGHLDNLAEALLISESGPDGKSVRRLKSFAEFEENYCRLTPESPDPYSKVYAVLQPFNEVMFLIHKFHPKDKPILWRILLTQAHIYEAIKRTREMSKSATTFKTLKMMPDQERKNYDWRPQNNKGAPSEEVLIKQFDIVFEYLKNKDDLKDFIETIDTKDTKAVNANKSIMFKFARSNEMEDVGYVIGINENSITLMQGSHKYTIPRKFELGYNGSEVLLNISAVDLRSNYEDIISS